MGVWPSAPQSRKVKVASSFEQLRDFIQKRMRMAHIYQPVMIKELLAHRGRASIRNFAAAFLARDVSQLEYYEQITKDMPGRVLAKHGIAERDGDDFRLTIDPSSLSPNEQHELVRLRPDARCWRSIGSNNPADVYPKGLHWGMGDSFRKLPPPTLFDRRQLPRKVGCFLAGCRSFIAGFD